VDPQEDPRVGNQYGQYYPDEHETFILESDGNVGPER